MSIWFGEPRRELLPPFGLDIGGWARGPLTERELELIERFRIDHLRVELHLSSGWRDALDHAARAALSVGARLELVLLLGKDPASELDELADALPLAQAGIVRFLVFEAGQATTGSRATRLARAKLRASAPSAMFVCGTDRSFAELNRDRPHVEGADAVAYSVCATVTAGNDLSLHNATAVLGDTVRSARAIFGKPVAVSPVTLCACFRPFPEFTGQHESPYNFEGVYGRLLCAAWTVASAKHLLEAGVSSLTYFEIIGPRGVAENEADRSLDLCALRPGRAVPLYHVLADLGDWRQTVLVPSTSSELSIDALFVRSELGIHALIANLSPEVRQCKIGPFSTQDANVRVLDDGSADAADGDPEAFRTERERRKVSGTFLELELGPYAVVRIDP